MKYPIDFEQYITAVRARFEVDAIIEKTFRELIPAANRAYDAGLRGERGYPLDTEEEIATYEREYGEPAGDMMPLILCEVKVINDAYEQGRREAGEAAT